MRLLAILLALLLAGCAAPAPTATAPPPEMPEDADLAEVILSDCLEHAVDIPVEAAEAQRFLPQGMKPRLLGPTGMATLELISVKCKSDVAGEDGAHAFIAWMPVEPPERMRASDISIYIHLFAMTTDDEGVASALGALGIPITVAPTTYAGDDSPLHLAGKGETKADGWSASIETLVTKREAVRTHPIFRVFVGNATGIAGAVDADGGSHPHYNEGRGTLAVTGKPPFPTPTAPGIAIHGYKGHLGFRAVALT